MVLSNLVKLRKMDFNSLIPTLSNSPPSIPYDVIYKICDEEDKVMGEVPGHKMILAMASEVMRNGFFGSDNQDKTAEVIRVHGTTVKACQTMFDFFYRRATNPGLVKAADIFEVVNLAKRYMIQKLEDDLMKNLKEFKVTEDNLIEVAKTARDYEKFEEASEILMNNCAKTLDKELQDQATTFEFINKLRATGDEVIGVQLITMIKKKTLCSNCHSSPCKSGSPVNNSLLRVGTRLKSPLGKLRMVTGFRQKSIRLLQRDHRVLGEVLAEVPLKHYYFFCETLPDTIILDFSADF